MARESVPVLPSNFFIVFQERSANNFNYFMQMSRFRNFPPISINTTAIVYVYENSFLVTIYVC